MRGKVALAGLVASGMISVGTVAACASSNTTDTADLPGTFNVTQVDVNGKKVVCVTWSDYRKGGLSCDWAGAK